MKGRFKFVHISETPSIEVVEDAGVFGSVKRIFVEEGVGGRGDD